MGLGSFLLGVVAAACALGGIGRGAADRASVDRGSVDRPSIGRGPEEGGRSGEGALVPRGLAAVRAAVSPATPARGAAR